jgi:hypothetical protein
LGLRVFFMVFVLFMLCVMRVVLCDVPIHSVACCARCACARALRVIGGKKHNRRKKEWYVQAGLTHDLLVVFLVACDKGLQPCPSI